MSKDELLIWLDKTLEKTIMVDRLNCGGCAVYAVMMGRALESKGIPVRIRSQASFTASGGHLGNVAEATGGSGCDADWHDRGVSFGHVFIEFDVEGTTYWLDGHRGYVEVNDEGQQRAACRQLHIHMNSVLEGWASPAQMAALAENQYNWNPEFSRTRGIPQLKRAIGAKFWKAPIKDQDGWGD